MPDEYDDIPPPPSPPPPPPTQWQPRQQPLDYRSPDTGRSGGRSVLSMLLRIFLIGLGVVVVLIAVLLGTCALLMRR